MNIFKKIKKSRPIMLVLIFICIISGVFIINSKLVFAAEIIEATGKIASNAAGEAIAIVIGFIALLFNGAVGLLTTLLVSILVSVSKFQNIIAVPAVEKGWTIIRDLCNMSFILILLVIAFATILRQENYSAKRLLPKLLIMAVLINFSKTIFGLIIDFAQVIMLTFVNGFAQYGAAKFMTMFNVADLLSINKSWTESALSTWSTIVAIILGMIASVITLIVVAVMLAVLVVRIVMLWIYTILSPLVFLGFAFPPIQKYTGKIWEDFSKQVIVGPVLAFFIWLALFTATESSNKLGLSTIKSEDLSGGAKSRDICENNAGASAFFCDTNFQAYIIAIALLIGGLMVTQQMGGAAASIAGKGMQLASKSYKPLMGLSAWGARKFAKTKYGFQINPLEIARQIKAGLEITKQKDILAGQARGEELLGKGGLFRGLIGGLGAGKSWTANYIQGVGNWKGFSDMWKTARHGQRTVNKRVGEYEEKKEKFNEKYKDVYGSEEERSKDIAIAKVKKEEYENEEEAINKKIEKARMAGKSEEVEALEKELGITKEKKEKTITEFDQIKARSINENKIKELAELKKIEKAIRKIKPPKGFEGRAATKALINEEKKKVQYIDNDEELTSYLRDAIEKKDKYRAIAIMEKMAHDGNENEYMNAFGYDSTAVGLHKFTNDILIKELGMNNQEALAVQSDIGYIAEKNHHWEVARTVGVRADGKLKSLVKPQRDEKTKEIVRDDKGNIVYEDSAHAKAAFAEIMKLDPQVIARALNRLAYGGERPREDGSGRDFMLSTLGLMLTKALSDSADFVDKHGSRFNINASQNLATPETVKLMVKANVKQDFVNMTKKKGRSEEGYRLDPATIYEIISKIAQEIAKEQGSGVKGQGETPEADNSKGKSDDDVDDEWFQRRVIAKK